MKNLDRMFFAVLGYCFAFVVIAITDTIKVHHRGFSALPVANHVPLAAVGLECHKPDWCPIILYPPDAGQAVVMPCDVDKSDHGICWRTARTDFWR